MKDEGNAVLAGVVNIALASLVSLSTLALSLAGYYNLVIRDAAIEAASNAARFGSQNQQDYLLKRLDISIPELASFEVSEHRGKELTHVVVEYSLPGLGLVGQFAGGQLNVAAATERL